MSGNIVDILLVVDADLIASVPRNQQAGQVANAVYLVAQRQLVDPNAQGNEQDGGYELWIDVKRGDVIRWRTTTLSRNFDKSSVITNVYESGTQSAHAGVLDQFTLQQYDEVLVPYVKADSDPRKAPDIGTTSTTVSLWQAEARAAGTDRIAYRIDFYLLDAAGNLISDRLSWDPFITVSLT
ncbi:AidA/PixA family protein [Pseudomonas putida]|uniref:Nematocidal protein AidA n=1 Tax=Pseudomonas putida TaxID=303 RepID=A0A177SQA3_PSEPU|nr:AidA/PixA family protein [Pseudomonas putida]OAI92335.1 hypothetical protein AYO28_18870 [Pseudomonas putida]